MEGSDNPFVSDLFIQYRSQQSIAKVATVGGNSRGGSFSSVDMSSSSVSTPTGTLGAAKSRTLSKLQASAAADAPPSPPSDKSATAGGKRTMSFMKSAQTSSVSVQFKEQLNSYMRFQMKNKALEVT